jgi:hypothetical protein
MQVHLWVEGGQQGVATNNGKEGNKGVHHILVDYGVYRTWVVVICIGYDVLWYQSIHLLNGTSQVCLGRIVRVLVRQVVPYISIPNGHG